MQPRYDGRSELPGNNNPYSFATFNTGFRSAGAGISTRVAAFAYGGTTHTQEHFRSRGSNSGQLRL